MIETWFKRFSKKKCLFCEICTFISHKIDFYYFYE